MQPPGHLQVISNMVDFGMNPQEGKYLYNMLIENYVKWKYAALDAPRIEVQGGTAAGRIRLEDGIPIETARILEKIGHRDPIILSGWSRSSFGTGQIIVRNPETGVLCAGSDPRNDGHAIGW